MPNATTKTVRTTSKKAVNLGIRDDLLREARAAGINLSHTLELALETTLRDRRRILWRRDNAEALAAYGRHVDRDGLFVARLRVG